jgi:viroplasmin and RNaseH domain-containing protein
MIYKYALSIEMMWYVVYKGWVPGVYDEWVDCQKQVHQFNNNYYKGYATREEALAKWRNHRWEEEPDEDPGRAPALAHCHCRCTLFDLKRSFATNSS